MKYPIKYIEDNLVFNHDGECFAYYELLPYNYSFLTPEQKMQVHMNFRQMIAQNREGKIHALQLSTERSLRSIQEESKELVSGHLKDVAFQRIDDQTAALEDMIGDNQIDYRFFIGFKLLVQDQEITLKSLKQIMKNTLSTFYRDVNEKLMGDFVVFPQHEVHRYTKMANLLQAKIERRFHIRPLNKNDFGYLIEHIYGKETLPFEDYEFHLPSKTFRQDTLVKYFDLLKPTRTLIEENQRYLKIQNETSTDYAAYFTIDSIVGELDFPSNEIFYYQQQQFEFPIDTSMNIEIVANKKALTTVRN